MVIIDDHEYLTEEEKRLKEDRERTRYWKKWGPYVAERQWSTGSFFSSILLPQLLLSSSYPLCFVLEEFSFSLTDNRIPFQQ